MSNDKWKIEYDNILRFEPLILNLILTSLHRGAAATYNATLLCGR